ncbi:MAG: hypothetical protein V8Q32_00080, partial [Anaerotignum faecicola]
VGKRPPWGSCIMELKNGTGRLMLGAGAAPASLCGVSSGRAGEHFLRGAAPLKKRRGMPELKWAFNPDAVGEGKRAEDFHTVLILAEEGGCSVPLAADFGEKTDWKAIFEPQKKAEPPKKEKRRKCRNYRKKSTLKQRKPQLYRSKRREPPEAQEKPLSAQGCHGSFQGLLAKFRRELENLEGNGRAFGRGNGVYPRGRENGKSPVKEGGQCADTGTERVDKLRK